MKNRNNFVRLVGFELRKNFLSPWMLLFLAVLLLLNGWKLQEEYEKKTREFADISDTYAYFYERWNGAITADKVTELMAVYGPLEEKNESMRLDFTKGSGTYTDSEYGDYRFFFSQFANEMKYDYLYVNEAIAITQRAQELAELYGNVGNTYEVRKNQAIANAFAGRSIGKFADTRYIEVWLEHDYSSMLVLLLCLFGLCTVFVTERETEMYMLQRTARLGSGATVEAKLTASALYMTVVCVLFFGEDFLILQLRSGHREALSSPVYAIKFFETTPLTMTVGQFAAWSGCVKLLGVMACGCVILLMSCLRRRVLTTFVASFGCLMVMVVLQEFCRTRVWLKWFNPLELVMVRELVTETTFVNVLGIPVPLYIFVIAGILLTIGALMLGILRFNPGRMERRAGKC